MELSEEELRMLPCLVASRLVQSVTMGAYDVCLADVADAAVPCGLLSRTVREDACVC